jgi:predicted nucleic acid-binding protein
LHHFTGHPRFGPACTDLLERIENGDYSGYTSAPVLGEVVHRLMTVEAGSLFGWPPKGIANRLRRHPAEVQKLSRYRQAIDELSLLRVRVLDSTGRLVSRAADFSRQTGLLSNDALIVATMGENGLTNLASNDADFDRVPGITRYAPA